MVEVIEYILCAVVVMANFSLGLYFSFRKYRQNASESVVHEVFLGSHTLLTLPLAVSIVASTISPTGVVALPAHFYAYGWHLTWWLLSPLLALPLAVCVFVPVLYSLDVTSIFQYIRLRFNSTISITACAIYLLLTVIARLSACFERKLVVMVTNVFKMQSVGAICIFAASLVLEKVFHVSLLWCNIAIGFSGTVYTAMGGLRGVVWTDCVQMLIVICAPATIIFKVIADYMAPVSTVRPLNDLEITTYIAEYRLDFTSEENIWSCLFGSIAPAMCRLCFDQVAAQRLLASRTLRDAQRTAITSSVLFVVTYGGLLAMGVALTIWFRGCDPMLSGAISRVDEVMPYYITTRLSKVPGLVGFFLAGVVCAATSTTSSTINSQAAILYVDVISPLWKNSSRHVLWITRCTALSLGVIMTVYSTLCVYLGSLNKVFLMVYTGLTSPYVGLCLLAVLFPFVHSKGAGVGTMVVAMFQMWHMSKWIQQETASHEMPGSLDYCPGNVTFLTAPPKLFNTNHLLKAPRFAEPFTLSRMSYFWSSFFGIFATIAIGLLVSALTGAMWSKQEQPELCSDALVRLWRKPEKQRGESQNKETKTSRLEEHNSGAELEKLVALQEEAFV